MTSVRCQSMHMGVRCSRDDGHAGWHRDGAWHEWLEPLDFDAELAKGRCYKTVIVNTVVHRCELPEGHPTAHKGNGYIWTEPHLLDEAKRKKERPNDAFGWL